MVATNKNNKTAKEKRSNNSRLTKFPLFVLIGLAFPFIQTSKLLHQAESENDNADRLLLSMPMQQQQQQRLLETTLSQEQQNISDGSNNNSSTTTLLQPANLLLEVPLLSLQPPNNTAASCNFSSHLNDSASIFQVYDPACSPVFPNLDSNSFPIKVGYVTNRNTPMTGEAKHIFYDGIMGSDYINVIGNVYLYQWENNTLSPGDADVWIVDGLKTKGVKPNSSESAFLDQILTQDVNTTWKVLVMCYSDFPYTGDIYRNKYHIHNQSHVRFAVRSIVQGRDYNDATPHNKTMTLGHVVPNHPTAGGPQLHSPFLVRSDTVEVIESVVLGHDDDSRTQNNASSSSSSMITIMKELETQLFLDPNYDTTNRTLDVIHLWHPTTIKNNKRTARLRNSVSHLIESWNGQHSRVLNRTLTTSTKEKGSRRGDGRNNVDSAYIEALLSSKIVIVTQRDRWEDHFRLMEALACGAMVISDEMLAPPKGIRHRETIVFFNNLNELQNLVEYYLAHEEERLAIAHNGWKLATSRHRAWHGMEELLFGQPLTATTTSAVAVAPSSPIVM